MEFIRNRLLGYGVDESLIGILSTVIMILFIALLCIIANFITKKVVIRFITHIVNKNTFKWDNVLLERKVFHRLSHIVPAIIIFTFARAFPDISNCN